MFKNIFLIYLIIASVVVNLIVPQLFKPFATPDEITPPMGASALSFKGQLMHMFVHHAQVPFSSSIIVAIIVLTSFFLGKYINNYVKN